MRRSKALVRRMQRLAALCAPGSPARGTLVWSPSLSQACTPWSYPPALNLLSSAVLPAPSPQPVVPIDRRASWRCTRSVGGVVTHIHLDWEKVS